MRLQKDVRIMIPRKAGCTVLFTDIRGFFRLSERMTVDELSQMLNLHYFSPLDNIIFEYIMAPWINISETASWGSSGRLFSMVMMP